MTQNKIPTDEYEFIKQQWGVDDRIFNRDPQAGWGDIVELIKAARAAGRAEGREEQRGRTITTLGALYLRDLKAMFPDGYVDLAFRDGWKTALDYAEQAIREHGEGNG